MTVLQMLPFKKDIREKIKEKKKKKGEEEGYERRDREERGKVKECVCCSPSALFSMPNKANQVLNSGNLNVLLMY